MASSARPPQSPEDFEACLARALFSGTPSASGAAPLRIAIGFSGGADSTLLLRSAAQLALRYPIDICALHVDHGLSENSARWAAHCVSFARRLGIPVEALKVRIERGAAPSLEAQARRARYAALTECCARRGVTVLVTAHNANDQAETLLLNLARGSGIAGLAAMCTDRPLGSVRLVRPFLEAPAAAIRACVEVLGLPCIADESNDDLRLTRNALRHTVMPALAAIAPDILAKLARTASLAAETQRLLDQLGLEDLGGEACDASGFDVARLRALSGERAANALRAWFRNFRAHAPSQTALTEMLAQLRAVPPSTRLDLVHEGEHLRVAAGRLVAAPRAAAACVTVTELRWNGEQTVGVPAWGGRIVFEVVAGPGIATHKLRSNPLTLRPRRGGERLKLDVQRPSRTLKNLYQEARITEPERQRLPLLFMGEQLVWAAGLGADVRILEPGGTSPQHVALHWEWDDSRAT